MRFIFADSLDTIDPGYDFLADRNGAGRTIHRDDQYPHEFLDDAPTTGSSSLAESSETLGIPGNIPRPN